MDNYGILTKVLFYDISQQWRAPAALALVDAVSCYDRIAHAIASLVFCEFLSRPHNFVHADDYTTDKRISAPCLWRLHHSSRHTYQSKNSRPHAGQWRCLCQSGGYLDYYPECTQIPRALCFFLYPASKMCNNISCILYIDDNNIIHLSEYDSGTAREALMALQDNITSWSNLLVATRSTLKPPKSFIYLLSYTWDTKGK